MRRVAYICLLIGIWAASLGALALGLDGLLGHPPFVPHVLLAGGYFGAVSTVSLAEEAAEAFGRIHPGLASPIFRLLCRCSPAAIAGFVMTIGVNAVN
jgi:hypothetical protein